LEIEKVNGLLKKVENILNDESSRPYNGDFRVGIDLGTADIVVIVVDMAGNPLAAFLEWSEVVRDGIVLDYWGAIQIVKKLISKAEQKLQISITKAVTSYPPGTDPQTSINVLQAAGIEMEYIIDEPSSVSRLLQIDEGAVVDIGGGTTGISIVKGGEIVYSADEPTGGRHITLCIAGNRKVAFEQAEEIKKNGQAKELFPIVQPVFEKMAYIVKEFCKEHQPRKLYLSGGTFCMPGIEQVFKENFKHIEIILLYNPLYLTPLSIAACSIQCGEQNG